MKYTNPKEIESSYGENDIGQTIYSLVLEHKPKKIIDFGLLHGYSTVAMAMALHDIGSGHIHGYDIFEDYEFKHGTKEEIINNLNRYGLAKYVTLEKKNFEEWLKSPEDFDFLHVDISNKGDTIERLYEAVKDKVNNGSIVIFEGGSEERDAVEWMVKYNKKKIRDAKVPFEIVDIHFPSLSIIKKS